MQFAHIPMSGSVELMGRQDVADEEEVSEKMLPTSSPAKLEFLLLGREEMRRLLTSKDTTVSHLAHELLRVLHLSLD